MYKIIAEVIPEPKKQDFSFYEELNKISQDLWGTRESLGELAICRNCSMVISKEVLFGDGEEVKNSLSIDLLKKDYNHCICPNCGSDDLEFPYGLDHVFHIRKRIKGSIETFLVIAKNDNGEIVGYKEGYIDNLERIFSQEYRYHYSNIGLEKIKEEIRKRIPNLLLNQPFMALGSIGLLPKYRSLKNVHSMIYAFYGLLPDNPPTCITEIDRRNILHRMMEGGGAYSLGIDRNPELSIKVGPRNQLYQSDLMIALDIKSIYTQAQKSYKEFVQILIKGLKS